MHHSNQQQVSPTGRCLQGSCTGSVRVDRGLLTIMRHVALRPELFLNASDVTQVTL